MSSHLKYIPAPEGMRPVYVGALDTNDSMGSTDFYIWDGPTPSHVSVHIPRFYGSKISGVTTGVDHLVTKLNSKLKEGCYLVFEPRPVTRSITHDILTGKHTKESSSKTYRPLTEEELTDVQSKLGLMAKLRLAA